MLHALYYIDLINSLLIVYSYQSCIYNLRLMNIIRKLQENQYFFEFHIWTKAGLNKSNYGLRTDPSVFEHHS